MSDVLVTALTMGPLCLPVQLSVLSDGLSKTAERRDFFEDLVHNVRGSLGATD